MSNAAAVRQIGLYLRTLRYLKPEQVASRFWRTRPRKKYAGSPAVRARTGDWTLSIPRPAAHLGGRRFLFLNEERTISTWNDPAAPRLWIYNLHYFEHPGGELIRTWIDENPEGEGAGWDPYPLSVRITNWIKWALNGGELEKPALESLVRQVRYLERRLEYHLLANHLLVNAKALVFAGCFFSGAEAESWLRHGARILKREINEQILADGGHFERSPMYHSLVLEDVLDLVNLGAAYPSLAPDWRPEASRMLAWLGNMTHPDGRISLFSDAAFDVAPEPASLLDYALKLRVPLDVLPLGESGYIRIAEGEAVAMFDAGPIGPTYQPGHGHADALSFELSYRGKRVIVDSGTSTYYPASSERLRQRGTLAHNTICLDGQDQSEVWDVFRVGRRARVFDVKTDHRTYAEAAHDGYRWKKPRVTHRRRLEFRDGCLHITDWLEGSGHHDVEMRFHLHPDADAKISLDPLLLGSREPATYHPGFNLSVPNTVVVGRRRVGCPATFRTRIVLG